MGKLLPRISKLSLPVYFCKFNLKIYYSHAYEQQVQHFEKANIEHIRKAINNFEWKHYFQYLNLNKIVFFSDKTTENILSNNIPQEIMWC